MNPLQDVAEVKIAHLRFAENHYYARKIQKKVDKARMVFLWPREVISPEFLLWFNSLHTMLPTRDWGTGCKLCY